MVEVACYQCDCVYCKDGWCRSRSITINEGYECETFSSYEETEEYQAPFYKAIKGEDGKPYKGLAHGKRIEYNGYVFYTQDRVYEGDDTYNVTEERTGYSCGMFAKLTYDDKWEKFVQIEKTLPDVTSYPLAVYDRIKHKYVPAKEGSATDAD